MSFLVESIPDFCTAWAPPARGGQTGVLRAAGGGAGAEGTQARGKFT